MARVRESIRAMEAYVPGTPTQDPAIIKLNANENRYPPSPAVAKAVADAAARLHIYPDSTSTDLRHAAAEVYGLEPNWVMAANGSDEMLRIIYQTCCDQGDEAVGFTPGYTYYGTLASMFDLRWRLLPLEADYALPKAPDFGAARLIIATNPNAPTGTLFPEADLCRIIEAAADTVVVIDEAYADFAGYTAIPLVKKYDNLIVTRTFSKSYALAGLRVGLGFAQPALLEQMEKVRDFYNLDRLAQAGAAAALRDQSWLRETCSKIQATRTRVINAVNALGLHAYDSAANFFMMRCKSADHARAVFSGLQERGVWVRYFRTPGLDDCLRVSIGTDADMEAFLAALRAVM